MRVVPIYLYLAGLLVAVSPALPAQATVASGDQIRLRIDGERTNPEVWPPRGKVKITFLDGPDSLRSVTREVSLPFSVAVSGDRLKVTIEPLGAAEVTTVRVEAQRDAKVLSEGTVTGRGAYVDVHGGSILLGTLSSAPGPTVLRYF